MVKSHISNLKQKSKTMNKVKIPFKAILRGFKRLWPFISIALKGMKKTRLKKDKNKTNG